MTAMSKDDIVGLLRGIVNIPEDALDGQDIPDEIAEQAATLADLLRNCSELDEIFYIETDTENDVWTPVEQLYYQE